MAGCCCEDDDQGDKPRLEKPERKAVCCTDIIFLLLFVAFWAGMLYVAIFSLTNGDGLRLVHGYDSFGNTCHRRNLKLENVSLSGKNLIGKENVFFMSILDPFDSMHICVSVCPKQKLLFATDVKQFAEDTGSRLCHYDIPIEQYDDASLYTENGPCPQLPVYKSISLMNRCFPDVTDLDSLSIRNVTLGIVQFFNADNIFRKVLRDMYASWMEMLLLCFVALGFALIMVFVIRFLAKILVWVIVVLAAVGSIAGTAFLWWNFYDINQNLNKQELLDIPLLDVDISNERAFLIFAIIATVLTIILLLVLLVMRSRLQFVVDLFHEASKCLIDVPLLLVQPIWTFIILMLFFAFWLLIMAYLSTSGVPTAMYDRDYTYVEYEDSALMRYMWWYYVIGLIWTSEFILACQQMVVAGAVSSWYFARNKKSLGWPIAVSTKRLVLHHLGSVAFGAFIITLVKFPRWVLMYIQKKCKGSESACAKFCLKCCICCLWCLEKLLKFLNQNAYTIIAMEGKSFCSAAQSALAIIVNNVLRVAAINSVGDFILFLAKVAVMAATAAVGIVWLKNDPDLHYYALPVLLVCVFAYFIAHCFLSVFEMVVDALLLCFCVDADLNAAEDRQYFMDQSMMGYVKDTTDGLNTISRRKPIYKGEADVLQADTKV